MKWSKLKQRIEESFADSIKDKIKIYTTTYKKCDGLSRSWFTIEGKQEVSFSDIESWKYLKGFVHEYTITDTAAKHPKIEDKNRDYSKLYEDGEFSSYDIKIIGFDYLNLKAHDCLKSRHPLLRVFAVLDKKVGKNKVKEMVKDEHPLVSYFAQYRLEQEVKYERT